MKRRFALPVVIAVSVEAILLFGFNKPKTTYAEPVRPTVTVLPDAAPVDEVVQPAPADDSESSRPRSAQPARPDLEEPPQQPSQDRIPIAMPPASKPDVIRTDRIVPGIPGPSIG